MCAMNAGDGGEQTTRSGQAGLVNVARAKQLDYLLEDYRAIKSEIARRSNLQRFVLLLYLAVVSIVFQRAASGSLNSLWVMGLWIAAWLSLLFNIREDLAMRRLGRIISDSIVPTAGTILNADGHNLLPSEMVPDDPKTERLTHRYDTVFKWAIFFVIPTMISFYLLRIRTMQLARLLDPSYLAFWAAILSLGLAICIVVLLRKRGYRVLRKKTEEEVSSDISNRVN